MYRDHKIGLALGILLVGAVAAFFFRHEDPPEDLPSLQTAAELDQRIAERSRTPYLQKTEEKRPTVTTPEPQPGGLVPDPIPLDSAADPLTRAAPPAAELAGKNHVVQRGETLSSIAAKYLGSAARFEEIYTANADRLRDPNDLRVGMELRIPSPDLAARPAARMATSEDRRAQRDGSRTLNADESVAPDPTPESPQSGPAKFEPYRRSPLAPQGNAPDSTAIDPKEAARRRLSQLPPRGDISPPR